jgi:hypothetical protein
MTAIIELYANNAQSTLASSITSSQTTITVASGTGVKFPNPVSGTQFFRVALTAASSPDTNIEVVYCTARSTDTLTVIRGQEGTTARAWSVLDLIANVATAGTYSQFLQPYFGTDTGVVNAYVVSTPQANSSYYLGMPVSFSTTNANTTTTPTLNVNGLGAVTITQGNGSALVVGQIAANTVQDLSYNSFDNTWRLQTPSYGQVISDLGYVPVQTVAGRTGNVTLGVADVSGAAPIASPTFTGTPAAPTASPGTSTTQLATTAFVATTYAPLASPTFTGIPAAPTAAFGTRTTQIASTAFVQNNSRPWVYVNSSITCVSQYYNVNTTAGGFTLTLPAFPATGTTVTFMDSDGMWGTNNWTLAGNGNTIMGYTSPFTINVSDQQFTVWYNGSEWRFV